VTVEDTPELVNYRTLDRIAVITLNRPPVNALARPLWLALGDALDRLAADESIHVAILTGQGTRAFCGGADLKELLADTDEDRQIRHRDVTPIQMKLVNAPVPVICAINGPAVGAGVGLASHCDIRIAVDTAHFSMTEVDRGTAAGGGAQLRRLGIPSGPLRRMLYTGQRISAQEALEIHLVDEVVPSEDLMTVALELAASIAAKSRDALVVLKEAILEVEVEPDWKAAYARTHRLTDRIAVSEGAREGLTAFFEKRTPVY